MTRIPRVVGARNIIRNMRNAHPPILDQIGNNLKKAGLLVQRESQKRVPVNTGNLRNTAFTRRTKPLEVRVGYTAAYALFVHENIEMKLKGQPRPKLKSGRSQGKYWDPQGKGQAKFLENAYKENLDRIRKIIRKGTEI